MQLTQLATKNFKKLGTTVINFTLGLNVLAGDNARGKSTALQAIKCALFGVSMVPGKKEYIPTWGQTKFEVGLKFTVNGPDYEVVRTGSTAKLTRTIDGVTELVANGTTPVNAYIEDLLGLSSKDYGLFIESEQGSSAGVLTFGATALNRKVEEYAGIDMIDKVQVLANQYSAKAAATADARRVLPEEMGAANDLLINAKQELERFEDAKRTADAALAAIGEFDRKPDPRNVQEMREAQRTAERLLRVVDQAESEMHAAERRHTELAEAFAKLELVNEEELRAQLAESKAAGVKLSEKVESIRTAKAALDKAEDRASGTKEKLGAALTAHSEAMDGWKPLELDADQRSAESLEDKVSAGVQARASLRVKIEQLQQLQSGAKCPACGHVKEDHDPAKMQEELDRMLSLLQTHDSANADLSAQLRQVTVRIAEHKNAETRLSRAAEAVAIARASSEAAIEALSALQAQPIGDFDAAQNALDIARDEYAAINAALKGIVASNEAYTRELNKLNTAMTDMTTAKDAFKLVDAQYAALDEPPTDEQIADAEAAHNEFTQAQLQWNSAKGNAQMGVREAEVDLRAANTAVTTSAERVQRLLDAADQAKKDEALAKKYSRLAQFLRERRQSYLAEVWDVITGVSSRLVNTASKGLVTAVASREGEFHFTEAGIEAPTSSASGAQKSFIGTALRVGLSRALYGGDALLIFDEPTESCSEQNAAGMAAVLASSAKQVLMITHRENDQVLAQNIINIGE